MSRYSNPLCPATEESPVKLYDLAASPNTRRVRIYLAEKGIEIPTVAIDMSKGEQKTPEYLAKNSLGKMPVLELDDGTCIAESVAICRYLEELHPEPPMFGRDALERARVEMWHRRAELEILQSLMHVFGHTHEMWKGVLTQIPEWGAACVETVQERYAWLDRELEGREFIATDDYTVADIALQCGLLMGKGIGVRAPDDLANLGAWWQRVSSRPTARA